MAVKLVSGIILVAIALYAVMGPAAGLLLLGLALVFWGLAGVRPARS